MIKPTRTRSSRPLTTEELRGVSGGASTIFTDPNKTVGGLPPPPPPPGTNG